MEGRDKRWLLRTSRVLAALQRASGPSRQRGRCGLRLGGSASTSLATPNSHHSGLSVGICTCAGQEIDGWNRWIHVYRERKRERERWSWTHTATAAGAREPQVRRENAACMAVQLVDGEAAKEWKLGHVMAAGGSLFIITRRECSQGHKRRTVATWPSAMPLGNRARIVVSREGPASLGNDAPGIRGA